MRVLGTMRARCSGDTATHQCLQILCFLRVASVSTKGSPAGACAKCLTVVQRGF